MSVRDVQAVIEASRYVRHGTTLLGGSFATCTCPKARCGGVAAGTERADCPEHQRAPVQRWHWDAECPVPAALTAAPHPYAAQAALGLARRGLSVFPLPAWGRVPGPGWQKVATADPERIRELFVSGGNIGVACRASRVVVLDLDRHGDGPEGVVGWEALCVQHRQEQPATFTVLTPHSGLHLYFRAPVGTVITSSSGHRRGLPPGIDVRAPGRRSGGYILGPGSQVANAGRYRIARDVPVAPMPEWLTRVLAAAVS